MDFSLYRTEIVPQWRIGRADGPLESPQPEDGAAAGGQLADTAHCPVEHLGAGQRPAIEAAQGTTKVLPPPATPPLSSPLRKPCAGPDQLAAGSASMRVELPVARAQQVDRFAAPRAAQPRSRLDCRGLSGRDRSPGSRSIDARSLSLARVDQLLLEPRHERSSPWRRLRT
jgi:hypothetical protein